MQQDLSELQPLRQKPPNNAGSAPAGEAKHDGGSKASTYRIKRAEKMTERVRTLYDSPRANARDEDDSSDANSPRQFQNVLCLQKRRPRCIPTLVRMVPVQAQGQRKRYHG